MAITEAVKVVQSHLVKGQNPTYGPVTDRLVEYGFACLREQSGEHKGQHQEKIHLLENGLKVLKMAF